MSRACVGQAGRRAASRCSPGVLGSWGRTGPERVWSRSTRSGRLRRLRRRPCSPYVAGGEVHDLDEHAVQVVEQVDELLHAGGGGHGGADGAAQPLRGGLVLTSATGLLLLGAGRPFGGGAVSAYDLEQAVFLLDRDEFAVGGEVVVPVAGGTQIRPDLGGGDVDVVGGVADGHPAAAVRVTIGRDAGGGDDAAGDVGPLLVAEVAVGLGGADGAVPHVLLGSAAEPPGLLDVQVEVRHEEPPGGVSVLGAAGVGGEAVPGGDQVRVGVVRGPLRVEQVPDQARSLLATADLRDHRATFLETASFAPAAMWRTVAPTAVRVASA